MADLKDILEYIPTYQIVNSITSLKNAKEEMESKKGKEWEGYDNYAHRLGMCESAKTGVIGALTGLLFGCLKEEKDLIGKTYGILGEKKIGFKEAFEDCKKDMGNNLDALIYCLTNPKKDSRMWLKDLDFKTNKWKSQ